ncbi:MAG: D-glycero-beta-D-manno-heptose-7-phosphate kinase [Bacteroidetes bacterium]|nr:MAG: D-glycero-beta-D-manno-heptose-7-phosphate kinase [Bacteroidota bacterium]
MTLSEIFDAFNGLNILIIGDVMIDSYLWGKVDRISPEAPVPVVNLKSREKRLGGAANVVMNVKALGCNPILCSVVGADSEANDLKELLKEQNILQDGLIESPNRVTTIKHRILAGSQHLLRIDSEMTQAITEQESEKLIEKVKELTKKHQIHAIIFEDYDKGVLTSQNIQAIISLAKDKKIPTVVDPKKRNFLNYAGCTLFKPNLKELKEGLNTEVLLTEKSLTETFELLNAKMPVENVLITLSEKGVFAKNYSQNHWIAAHPREIADVSGAGDTVVSIAAACFALRLPLFMTASLANLGGGLVCEYLGVVPVSKEKLFEEAKNIHF